MSTQPLESNNAHESNRQDDLKIWSCINCRRRKVRCDRRHPCSPCTRGKAECVFPVSGRIPRRDRGPKYPKPAAQKQEELLGRLRRLEAMVSDLGSQVENVAVPSQNDSPAEDPIGAASEGIIGGLAFDNQSASGNFHTTPDGIQAGSDIMINNSNSPRVSNESGDMFVASNGNLVVGDRFWAVFCKEVEQIFEAVNGPTITHFDRESSSSTTSDNQHNHDYYKFLLKSTSAMHQRDDLYPLPSQMLFLWQIYTDNIDPFMKVLHVPTMTKVIRELKGTYQSLDYSMQALVLAVSFAAVMSLEDEVVHVNFNTDKIQLLTRYRLGTEQALEKADFLNNPNMTAVQALAVYLGVLQHTGEMKSAWILAGVLIRVAVSMRLHRDGSHLAGISLFETELRRRLWWQICSIDSRSEDMHVSAYKLSGGMFDTERPVNVNDTDLDSGMSSSPIFAENWTDMTAFLVRCEVWKLSRDLQSVPTTTYPPHLGADQRIELFRQSRAKIEDIYLKHLNPDEPLHSFVATNTRLFLTKVGLILFTKAHSSNETEILPIDLSTKDKKFISSLSIIECTYALQNEPKWSGWRWQIQGRQPPWNAFGVLLSQLCTRQWEPICERAWSSTKKFFDDIPEAFRGDIPYQQLLRLASAVQRHREEELQHQNSGISIMSTTASSLSIAFAKYGLSRFGLESLEADNAPFVDVADDFDNFALGEGLNLEMDWQDWENVARDLEPSLEFWDIGGF